MRARRACPALTAREMDVPRGVPEDEADLESLGEWAQADGRRDLSETRLRAVRHFEPSAIVCALRFALRLGDCLVLPALLVVLHYRLGVAIPRFEPRRDELRETVCRRR